MGVFSGCLCGRGALGLSVLFEDKALGGAEGCLGTVGYQHPGARTRLRAPERSGQGAANS